MSATPDRKLRRRTEILEAAQRVFLRKGFVDAGIADIAGELGIGHGTIYRYYKNKQEIAVAVLDQVTELLASVALSENPQESNSLADYRAQTRRILSRLVELTTAQPEVIEFFRRQGLVIDPERLTRFYEMFAVFTARFLDNGVAKGFLRAQVDVKATSELLVTLIFEGATRSLQGGDPDTAKRWMESGMALMFDGIAAPR